MSAPLQIFIAYARKDASFLDELRTHFTPLERSGKVKIWYDGKIEPGAVWEQSIKENLHKADVILLLVSADAIASDYFYDKEMTDALARHNSGTARVVPLIVRPCAWQETPLGELQALPRDAMAVTEWANRDAAYANAVNSLTAILNSIRMERAAAAEQAERERNQTAEETRRQREAAAAAAQEAERRKKEQEQAAEKQRQLEAQRKQEAEAADRRRQQEEADRLKKAEEERQRKAAAALQREQQMAAVGSTLRSPKVWGSGLVGVLALVLGNWLCNREPAPTLPPTGNTQDTTTLTENTPIASDTETTGVKTISPEQLPKDVTVEQPKQKENEIVSKEQTKEKKTESSFIDPFADDMIFIDGGVFSMGCDIKRDGDCNYEDERPLHSVSIKDFYMCRYEVTQEQWLIIMGNPPMELRFKGCGKCPVENVSWNDIQTFLIKLNTKTGKDYRLPTEAEWEFAARGGVKNRGYKYAGSNELGEVAWFKTNSNSKTKPVGGKRENELGLYDMSGNVWEWCQDIWHDDYVSAPKTNISWTVNGKNGVYVLRGGSWFDAAGSCRNANRYRNGSDYRGVNLGFRLAR
jgi:formylglycine-generating enzyme required for sulfatase activity